MLGDWTPADFHRVFQLICHDFGDEGSFSEIIYADGSFFDLPERFKDSYDGKFQLAYRQHCGTNSRSNPLSLNGPGSTKKPTPSLMKQASDYRSDLER